MEVKITSEFYISAQEGQKFAKSTDHA